MKYALFLILILLAPFVANAQTFIGGGFSVTRSTAYDPSPLATGDGGKVFAGAYVEAGYDLRRGLQVRVLGEYLSEPTLTNIFTQDENVGRFARDEFRLRPELRYQRGADAPIRPFIGGGVDYYRQRFESVKGRYGYGGYGSGAPAAGLNPYLVVGAGICKSHEASYARLFTDTTTLNDSRLSGHRVGYTYTRPLSNRLSLRVAGEIDYVKYSESNGRYIDSYYERDAAFKLRVGLVIQ